MLSGFPAPPSQVRQALISLAVVRGGDADAIAELGDIHDLPRPWDPASCPPLIRQHLWLWCDDVAAWLNRDYAWRPVNLIPACWPRHPHIARELPVLACLRTAAGGPSPSVAPRPARRRTSLPAGAGCSTLHIPRRRWRLVTLSPGSIGRRRPRGVPVHAGGEGKGHRATLRARTTRRGY